jgi:hypothetical protein
MQLDLFLDGRETILVNDLVAALLAGRLEGARDALNRLRKENPAHPDLAAFDRLVRSLCEKPLAPPSTGEPGPIIERLTLLVPAANRLLGLGAAPFLLPCLSDVSSARRRGSSTGEVMRASHRAHS